MGDLPLGSAHLLIYPRVSSLQIAQALSPLFMTHQFTQSLRSPAHLPPKPLVGLIRRYLPTSSSLPRRSEEWEHDPARINCHLQIKAIPGLCEAPLVGNQPSPFSGTLKHLGCRIGEPESWPWANFVDRMGLVRKVYEIGGPTPNNSKPELRPQIFGTGIRSYPQLR